MTKLNNLANLLKEIDTLSTQAMDLVRQIQEEENENTDPPPIIELPTYQASPAFHALNMTVRQPVGARFILTHFFTTYYGSWESKGNVFQTPPWARELFLKPNGDPEYFDDAGGDHHLFGAVMNSRRNLIKTARIRYSWPDGNTDQEVKERSGWANLPIWNSFDPDIGESGVWMWYPIGTGGSEIISGGGLPKNHHVSMFAVWMDTQS